LNSSNKPQKQKKKKKKKKTIFQTKGDSSSLFFVVPIGFIRLHPQAPICVLTVSKKIAFNLSLDSVELEVLEHFKSRHQKNALDPENEEPRKSQSRQIWAQDLSSIRCCFLSFSFFLVQNYIIIMCGVYSRRHLPLPTLESLETSLSLLFMLWGARVLDIPIPTLTCEKRKQKIKLKTGDVGA
jgi:hypothetical protein